MHSKALKTSKKMITTGLVAATTTTTTKTSTPTKPAAAPSSSSTTAAATTASEAAVAAVAAAADATRNSVVDAARDAHYCPEDPRPAVPRAAPRANPPTPKPRSVLPPTTATAAYAAATATRQTLDSPKQQQKHEANTAPRSKQRLIKVDFSLLQDDDHFFDDSFDSSASRANAGTSSSSVSVCAQPKMPPYPIGGYMVDATASSASTAAPSAPLPAALTTRVLRRTSI